MKNLTLTLIAAIGLFLSSNAQTKAVELTKVSDGDSILVSFNKIYKVTASGNDAVVEFLSVRGKEVVVVDETVANIKAADTGNQMFYQTTSILLNKDFFVDAQNKIGDTTSVMFYQYDGAPKFKIDLEFSIDSLKSAIN